MGNVYFKPGRRFCPKRRIIAMMTVFTLLMSLFCPAAVAEEAENYDPDMSGFKTGVVNARASVHDPSIIVNGDKYYIFGSHMTAAVSDNLRNWDRIANSYSPKNPVWGDLFAEGLHVFDWAGAKDSLIPTDDGTWHVWAPDVIYNRTMEKYVMYYCTTSTWCISNLCYAIADKIEGPYEWQGPLIYSGFDRDNITATDVLDVVDEKWANKTYLTLAGGYDAKKWPNAIDPTAFYDADGRMWMVYGSWSGGIFLLELDPATGLVIHPEADPENDVDPYFGRKLMGGGHHSIEGPYIHYDENSGYYYLFVSYGELRAQGGYQIRVFRARNVEGPYEDMNGTRYVGKGNHAPYGLKLSGNYILPGVKRAYMATGHNSAFTDTDGKTYLCYHTRFNDGTEGHLPMVKQYVVNREGWPCLLPYSTRKETADPMDTELENVTGRYFVVSQGTGINPRISEPVILYLRADGTVGGQDASGEWTREDGTVYMTLKVGENAYSGVFCAMQDDAGTDVMTFSAVGGNESIWGVKY